MVCLLKVPDGELPRRRRSGLGGNSAGSWPFPVGSEGRKGIAHPCGWTGRCLVDRGGPHGSPAASGSSTRYRRCRNEGWGSLDRPGGRRRRARFLCRDARPRERRSRWSGYLRPGGECDRVGRQGGARRRCERGECKRSYAWDNSSPFSEFL